jgi:DNA-binding NarL/FixJ family response regulator
MQITGSYSNGAALQEGLAQKLPDVLLLDIQMPGQTGDELAPILLKQYPTMRILALTNQDDLYYINSMLNNGVVGYVLKTTSEDILLNAIRTIHAGGEYVDQSLKEKIIQQAAHAERIKNETPMLSHREKEVLAHIAADLTSQQIADAMFISKRTVDNHRQSLLLKLGVKNVASLVKKAMHLGLLD